MPRGHDPRLVRPSHLQCKGHVSMMRLACRALRSYDSALEVLFRKAPKTIKLQREFALAELLFFVLVCGILVLCGRWLSDVL